MYYSMGEIIFNLDHILAGGKTIYYFFTRDLDSLETISVAVGYSSIWWLQFKTFKGFWNFQLICKLLDVIRTPFFQRR